MVSRRRLRPGRRARPGGVAVPRDPPGRHQPRRVRLRDARPPHAAALGAPRRDRRRGRRGHRLRAGRSPTTCRRDAPARPTTSCALHPRRARPRRGLREPRGDRRRAGDPTRALHTRAVRAVRRRATRSCRPAWAGWPAPGWPRPPPTAGGLGILASATMTLDELRDGHRRGQGAAPTSPSASTCAPTQPDVGERIDLLIGERRAGGRLRPGAQAATLIDRAARTPACVVMPTDRRPAPRREGGRVGRRRRASPRAARAAATPARCPTVAAAAPGGRRRRRRVPVHRRRRLLRRPRPGRRAGLRRRRHRHGHPLPAHRATRRCPTRSRRSTSRTPVTDTVVTTQVDGVPQRVIRTDLVDAARAAPAGRSRCPRAVRQRLRSSASMTGRRWRQMLTRGPGHEEERRSSRGPGGHGRQRADAPEGGHGRRPARGRHPADRPGRRRDRRPAPAPS